MGNEPCRTEKLQQRTCCSSVTLQRSTYCSSATHNKHEITERKLVPEPDDLVSVHNHSAKAHSRPGTEPRKINVPRLRLDGQWKRDSDNAQLCTIKEGKVLWDKHFRYPDCKLSFEDGAVQLEMEGKVHQAKVESGRLVWSDGDIWSPRDQEKRWLQIVCCPATGDDAKTTTRVEKVPILMNCEEVEPQEENEGVQIAFHSEDGVKHVNFTDKPFGMSFERRLPIIVFSFEGSRAKELGIQTGWEMKSINGIDLTECRTYEDAMEIIKRQCSNIRERPGSRRWCDVERLV